MPHTPLTQPALASPAGPSFAASFPVFARLHHVVLRLALLAAALAPAGRAADTSAAPEPAPPSATADQPIDDAARFPPWVREVIEVFRTNSARARQISEAKLTEARAAGDRVTEGWALLMVSTAMRRLNDLPGALALSREALSLADSIGNDLFHYNANYIHGLSFNASGDYASAIDFFLRSLRYADARSSIRARTTTIAALGSAYEHLGDLEKSLAYKTEALALAEQTRDERAVSMYANNLAILQDMLGDRVAARRNFERALVYRRAEGNRTEIADLEEQLAMLDFADGKTDAALAALGPILAQRRTLRGRVKLTHTLICLAEVLQKLGRLDEALAHAEEARGYTDAIESRNLRAGVYKRLAAVQEARGDLAGALASTRREFAEREAMAGEAARKRAAELQIQFDTAKKDQELVRLARVNEVQAAENRAREAQLAQSAAELRAKEAELRARDADLVASSFDLERSNAMRFALGSSLLALAVALGAVILLQRVRLRAERRIVAETQAARLAAEEADRVKTRFLGIASHDIRAPLGNILNLSESLRTDPPGSAERTAHLATIVTEAQRVLGLVEDLLTTAALENGKLELRHGPLDLAEIVTATVNSLRWQAAAKQQVITFAPAALDTGVLTGDAARLHQVVTNLLTNALKFSPAGATIALALARSDSTVTLSVRDQGPGLSESDVARLFTPFQRLSASPAAGVSSHGLGLSIAHEIVRLHGGSIRVESRPGAGATFHVELPATPPAAT